MFVVQPYSRPIPSLSRELTVAVFFAVTVIVNMALAVAAILAIAMEALKVCVSI